MRRWAPALAGAALIGCAYYNGLYNANRLASDARRAEREGRPAEARTLWARAAQKAESVTVRFPKSGYRDDALLLWGRGLKNAESCRGAVLPLRAAMDSGEARALRDEARLLLGECWNDLREPDSASAVLAPLVEHQMPRIRRAALLARGRAALRRGEYAAAIQDLTRADSMAAAFDLAVAYLGAGRRDAARATLAARLGGPFDEPGWRTALDSLGRHDPDEAARLIDSLVGRRGLSDGQRGRLLLGDADRRSARRDTAEAWARMEQVLAIAPDSAEGGIAAARLLVSRFRADPDVLDSLSGIVRAFGDVAARGGQAAQLAEPFAAVLGDLAVIRAQEELPNRDLRLFVLAEALRDSLEAPGTAGRVFLELARDLPESFVAPKALVAAVALGAAPADSVRAVLRAQYAASPYTLALDGRGGAEFAALEDSLAALTVLVRRQLRSPVDVRGLSDEEVGRRRRRQ